MSLSSLLRRSTPLSLSSLSPSLSLPIRHKTTKATPTPTKKPKDREAKSSSLSSHFLATVRGPSALEEKVMEKERKEQIEKKLNDIYNKYMSERKCYNL
jgi:hypothetical protein